MTLSAPAKLAMISEVLGELEPLTSLQMLHTFIAIAVMADKDPELRYHPEDQLTAAVAEWQTQTLRRTS